VLPHFSQGHVFWLTRRQLRGPGSVEGACGPTLVPRIEVPSLALPPFTEARRLKGLGWMKGSEWFAEVFPTSSFVFFFSRA
jgi:hypothetical protein